MPSLKEEESRRTCEIDFETPSPVCTSKQGTNQELKHQRRRGGKAAVVVSTSMTQVMESYQQIGRPIQLKDLICSLEAKHLHLFILKQSVNTVSIARKKRAVMRWRGVITKSDQIVATGVTSVSQLIHCKACKRHHRQRPQTWIDLLLTNLHCLTTQFTTMIA